MRYRAIGDPEWRTAETENVGKNGVLFRDDESLSVDTPIEMVLSLPLGIDGEPGATTTCRGRVVRVEVRSHGEHGTAATIDSFFMSHTKHFND